jgi:hypothetical protein
MMMMTISTDAELAIEEEQMLEDDASDWQMSFSAAEITGLHRLKSSPPCTLQSRLSIGHPDFSFTPLTHDVDLFMPALPS